MGRERTINPRAIMIRSIAAVLVGLLITFVLVMLFTQAGIRETILFPLLKPELG